MNRKKALKEDVTYEINGYTYVTDSNGRIESVSGVLDNNVKGKRNNYAQRNVGRDDRLHDDHGGYLIASMFGGAGDIDNLVPMNGPNVNGSGGEFYKLESIWTKHLNKNEPVSVTIKLIYNSNKNRPDFIKVDYDINGVSNSRLIENK